MSLFNRLLVTTLPLVPKFIVGKVAAPYVAGESLDEALHVLRELEDEGAMATLDVLGEAIERIDQADAAVEEYLAALDLIREHKLNCNISIKPTQLGLMIDEERCYEHFARLLEVVCKDDNFLRIDMEDRHTTDASIRVYRRLTERFHLDPYDPGPRGRVGVVFQAYMRRALQDIAELPDEHANVRLCKGIYNEPREAAWKGYETVRHNFLAALEKLLRQGVYVGIATHDEHLACGAVALLDKLGVPKDRYEFQMLLGVDPRLRKILLDGGHRLRVYVPYGRDWYLYSIRRLRENPEVAMHVLKAMVRPA